MTMLSIIRRAFDVARLTRELEEAESTIRRLREERSAPGPSYGEVSKDFDAAMFFPHIRDQVISEMAPFVKRDAIDFLTKAFKAMDREHPPGYMRGSVAHVMNERAYEFRFEIDRCGVSVKTRRGWE